MALTLMWLLSSMCDCPHGSNDVPVASARMVRVLVALLVVLATALTLLVVLVVTVVVNVTAVTAGAFVSNPSPHKTMPHVHQFAPRALLHARIPNSRAPNMLTHALDPTKKDMITAV